MTIIARGPGLIVCDLSDYFGYCQAETKRHEQCKRTQMPGSKFCKLHTPVEPPNPPQEKR